MNQNRILKITLFLILVFLLTATAFWVLVLLGQHNADLIKAKPQVIPNKRLIQYHSIIHLR